VTKPAFCKEVGRVLDEDGKSKSKT
jgi:hypothetical protein